MFALSYKKQALAIISAAAFAVLPLGVFAQPDQDQDDPPPEAGRLSYISGNVSIQPVTSEEWGQAYPNLPVGPGDRIFTDADGRAEIQVGQTYVRIGPNTDVTLVDDSQFNINFGVAQGSIRVHSFGLWPRQLLDISTPNGNAEFANNGDLRVDVMPNDGATVFTNLGQFADITGAGNFRQELDYGQSLEVAGSNPVYPQWLQPAGPDDLDSWSQQRDQQMARVVSYQYASPDIPGVADLDTYGDWQPATEYGAVWFPRQVPADWEPYHYGHWINRDPWGWVWVEDEPWGYAPFHYGRWVVYGGRWGWVPGPVNVRPVWSPALVVFAGGNFGVGLSAWFPLGPGEPYRPWYRCSPRYIDQVNITNIRPAPRVHVERTYVNIVNVTNVTYVNRTYITAVPKDDFASGRSVRNVAVRVDPREVRTMHPLNRPDVAPTPRAIVTRPVGRPVPVPRQRPMLINQQGREIAAKPHANPVAPPVRPIAQPRPIPGRTVVATPPHPNPPGRPGQFPAEQGNQRSNSPHQGLPPGVPGANPVPPQDGLRHPIVPGQGNPSQPAERQQGPVNAPRANPVGPQQGIQRPVEPNQTGRPNEQRPPQPTGRPLPPPPNTQQPERPGYQQQQRPENPQPGKPGYQQPNNPMPGRPNYQQPQQPNNQRPDRPDFPQPGRPNPPTFNQRPVNPPQQVEPNRPAPPSENRQPERPNQDRPNQDRPNQDRPNMDRRYPPPQPQGRPVPPPQQERQAPPPQPRYTPPPQQERQAPQPQPRYTPPPQQERQAPQPRFTPPPPQQRQQAAPPQQNRPKPDQNRDQKKNDKKDERKHD